MGGIELEPEGVPASSGSGVWDDGVSMSLLEPKPMDQGGKLEEGLQP